MSMSDLYVPETSLETKRLNYQEEKIEELEAKLKYFTKKEATSKLKKMKKKQIIKLLLGHLNQ